jgi:hypothetical protein
MYFNADNPEHQHTRAIDLSTGEKSGLCVLECDTGGNWLRVIPHPFRPSDAVPAELHQGFAVVDGEGRELARSAAAPSAVHMWADLNSEDEAEREIGGFFQHLRVHDMEGAEVSYACAFDTRTGIVKRLVKPDLETETLTLPAFTLRNRGRVVAAYQGTPE